MAAWDKLLSILGMTDRVAHVDSNSVDDYNMMKNAFQELCGDGSAPPSRNLKEINDTIDEFAVIIGQTIMYDGIDDPDNFFLCDGAAYSRETYTLLYNRITKSKGSCTISIASPAVVTLNAHGLQTGARIELSTTGALPTGITAYTNYYIGRIDDNTFYLYDTYVNAVAGGTTGRINTSGSQSGTHTLRYVPHGTPNSTEFYVPNRQGVVSKGVGSQMINGRVKTGPGFGGVEEDRFQKFKMDVGVAPLYTRTVSLAAGATSVYVYDGTGTKKYIDIFLDDGTNGTPRTGTTTRENSLGTKFYIRYQ